MPADQPVFLSRQLGRPVSSSDTLRVGRVVDLTVLYDVAHPAIHRLGVGHGRRIQYFLPWQLVDAADEHAVRVAVDQMGVSAYASETEPMLEDRELLLARDVLDTQVADLAGRRLSRVSDVILAAGPDSSLEVAAVDVGAGSLLRRMGFRRLGARLTPIAVDWGDLHFTSARGHTVQLTTAAVRRLNASGLAELLARLSPDKAVDVVRNVPAERSAAALHASHPELRRRVLYALEPQEVRRLLDAAPPALARLLCAI